MSIFAYISLGVGSFLLFLGVISGVAIFLRSLKKQVENQDMNTASLWSMFLLGISAGMVVIWFALPS